MAKSSAIKVPCSYSLLEPFSNGALDFLHNDPEWHEWLNKECERIVDDEVASYMSAFEEELRGSLAKLVRDKAPGVLIQKYRELYSELRCQRSKIN